MVTLTAAPPDLRPWIELLWSSEGELDSPLERVLPSATCEIVVNLGAPMTLLDPGSSKRLTGSIASGLMTSPLVIAHPKVHQALGMRLTPLGLGALLHAPSATLANTHGELAEVLEQPCDVLAQRCHSGRTPEARLALAIDWARQRIAQRPRAPDPLVAWSLEQLTRQTHDARIDIDALVRRSGYGATRFRRRFVDELGVTPQQLARLLRFRRALDRLDAHTPLAHLALEVGYVDQAHMCRDFQRFAAATPTQVLASRYPSGLTLAQPA